MFTYSISAFLHFCFFFFFFFLSKIILVSLWREQRKPRFCSYFQAKARKNPGRCFILYHISRRNSEQVTARTCPRLPPSSTCLRVPTYRVFSSVCHALTPYVLDPRYCLLKCLRTVAAVASLQLQTLRTLHRDDVPKYIRTPSSTVMGMFALRKRAPFISELVPSRESLTCPTSDISYALSAVVMDGDILCCRSFVLGVDHYTFYEPVWSPRSPR